MREDDDSILLRDEVSSDRETQRCFAGTDIANNGNIMARPVSIKRRCKHVVLIDNIKTSVHRITFDSTLRANVKVSAITPTFR